MPFQEKLVRPADCAPRLICFTSAPLASLMLSTTCDVVCGTLMAPVTVAPAAKFAVPLLTRAWWPSSDDACSAWLEESEPDRVLKEVLRAVMPCTSLSEASCCKKVLLSTGLV